ncbi:hypothetical protein CS559_03107 [Dickeya solani]|nr:hypothetical protein [Dickeya solani]RJR95316.1 hypothetical protein CTB90_03019 [Dickeya solani]RJR95494.1 hypothetical protein CS559_03107 [Dickeya solani]
MVMLLSLMPSPWLNDRLAVWDSVSEPSGTDNEILAMLPSRSPMLILVPRILAKTIGVSSLNRLTSTGNDKVGKLLTVTATVPGSNADSPLLSAMV